MMDMDELLDDVNRREHQRELERDPLYRMTLANTHACQLGPRIPPVAEIVAHLERERVSDVITVEQVLECFLRQHPAFDILLRLPCESLPSHGQIQGIQAEICERLRGTLNPPRTINDHHVDGLDDHLTSLRAQKLMQMELLTAEHVLELWMLAKMHGIMPFSELPTKSFM